MDSTMGVTAGAGSPAWKSEGTGAAQQTKPAGDARLKHAAREFESMLLEEILRPLQNVSMGGEEDGGAGDTLGRMAGQAMASAIAAQGGLGIAGLVLRGLPSGRESVDGSADPSNGSSSSAIRR